MSLPPNMPSLIRSAFYMAGWVELAGWNCIRCSLFMEHFDPVKAWNTESASDLTLPRRLRSCVQIGNERFCLI